MDVCCQGNGQTCNCGVCFLHGNSNSDHVPTSHSCFQGRVIPPVLLHMFLCFVANCGNQGSLAILGCFKVKLMFNVWFLQTETLCGWKYVAYCFNIFSCAINKTKMSPKQLSPRKEFTWCYTPQKVGEILKILDFNENVAKTSGKGTKLVSMGFVSYLCNNKTITRSEMCWWEFLCWKPNALGVKHRKCTSVLR